MCKMQEDDNLLNHVNKIKGLVNQLTCLEVSMKDKDIVMILFKNLPTLYKYFTTVMKKTLIVMNFSQVCHQFSH